MSNEYIPRATADKLAEHHPKGTRHQAALDIAVSLIGNGLPAAGVFATLRSKFEEDVTDKELHDVVHWASNQGIPPTNPDRPRQAYQPPTKVKHTRTPLEQVEWWTSGSRSTADKVEASSPVGIPEDNSEACALAIGSLYSDSDFVNVVCQYFTGDDAKAKPFGAGKILKRDAWVEWIKSKGVPESDAGGWMRLNPCSPTGTGKDGAVADGDITSFRYLLIESDILPLPMQLALLQRLKLPIVAIILSGGTSAHAWVKMNSPDEEDYKEKAKLIFANLEPFGIDKANKNPSRLCRLPGATRVIGAQDGGIQRLLFLNPNAAPVTAESLKQFEESLEFPAIEDRPLLALARDASARYEEMRRNAGRLGVSYGIPKLDRISGGMKPGQTIAVAGMTGGGKSTYGLHVIDTALRSNIGVLLFSLEMDREELFDLIVSNHCEVDRNKFNNGRFEDADFDKVAHGMPTLAKLPLYIEDSSLTSTDQIRLRTLQLKASGKIGLVVVDYIQFVNPGLTKESREQQVAGISHTLRSLARETKLPFVILSQLNDEGKLRESRVITHNANVVLVIEVDGDTFKIRTTKGRGIPLGEYELEFDRQFARLVTMTTPDFGALSSDQRATNNAPYPDP